MGSLRLVLDNVSNTDFKAVCQEMYTDLGFLAGVVPERFGLIVVDGRDGTRRRHRRRD